MNCRLGVEVNTRQGIHTQDFHCAEVRVGYGIGSRDFSYAGYEPVRVFPFLQGLWSMENYSISTAGHRGLDLEV